MKEAARDLHLADGVDELEVGVALELDRVPLATFAQLWKKLFRAMQLESSREKS